jgi:non-canonical (house-cleaning) NTP pyrophosphatase
VLKTHVRDRATAQSMSMSACQKLAINRLANELHRLNNAVIAAVESGISVELQRGARHHSEGGYWGDLMIPIVVKQNCESE